MINCKEGVRFKRITPEMMRLFPLLVDVWKEHAKGIVPMITSANDSKHLPTSYHFQDYAIDVRSKDLTDLQKDAVLAHLRMQLTGLNYDVLLEHRGGENEHFHIEFNARKKV